MAEREKDGRERSDCQSASLPRWHVVTNAAWPVASRPVPPPDSRDRATDPPRFARPPRSRHRSAAAQGPPGRPRADRRPCRPARHSCRTLAGGRSPGWGVIPGVIFGHARGANGAPPPPQSPPAPLKSRTHMICLNTDRPASVIFTCILGGVFRFGYDRLETALREMQALPRKSA